MPLHSRRKHITFMHFCQPPVAAHTQLDEGQYKALWKAGWAMTLDEAVAYALEQGIDSNHLSL